MWVIILPRFARKTVIVKPGLVEIHSFPIRPQYSHVPRCEIEDLPEFYFALPGVFFRLLCRCDVGQRPDQLEVTRVIPRRVSGHTDVLDGTVGQVQPMLKIKALAVTECSVDLPLHQIVVLAMNSREDKINRRFRPRITLKDTEGLVGPEDLPTGNLPAEATCMT